MAEEEYEVESILDHRLVAGTMEFLVQYRGYPPEENSYEPEYNLAGCDELRREYLANLGLPTERTSPDPLELSNCSQADPDNMCTMAQVLSKTRIYRKSLRRSNELDFDQFPGEHRLTRGRDMLYVHLYQSHFFVYLIMPRTGRYFVIDGANACFDMMEELSRIVGHSLVSLEFNQQRGSDYCASSAVVIMLELMRLYKDRDDPSFPGRIIHIGFRVTHARIVSEMHKGSFSSRGVGRVSIADQPRYTCRKCGKVFGVGKKLNGIRHERLCRGG